MIRGYCEACQSWCQEGHPLPCLMNTESSPPAICGLSIPHHFETATEAPAQATQETFEERRERQKAQANATEPPVWSYGVPDGYEEELQGFNTMPVGCNTVSPYPVVSDGGSSSYYDLPKGATELNDLIEHKNMGFARGNIFKACYRLGEKSGTDALYDVNKIIFFAERMKGVIAAGGHL